MNADWPLGEPTVLPVLGEVYLTALARDWNMTEREAEAMLMHLAAAGFITRSPEGVLSFLRPDGSVYAAFDDANGRVVQAPGEWS